MADRKISDLTALTTPASGDFLPIVDISEAAAATKNKRITIEELMRGMPDGTAAAPGIAFENDPNTGIYSPGADTLAFVEGGVEAMRIDSSGRVGIGTSSPGNLLHVSGTGTVCQLASSNNNNLINLKGNGATNGVWLGTTSSDDFLISSGASISERARIDSSGRLLVGTSTDFDSYLNQVSSTSGSLLSLRRTNSNPGSIKLSSGASGDNVGNNGQLGYLRWYGFHTSTDYEAARISAEVDGTPGANDMPGRLVFSTTADGASSPTERLCIDSSGRLLVGTSSARSNLFNNVGITPTVQLETTGNSARALSLVHNSNDDAQSIFVLGKSRGTAAGSATVVSNNDLLGAVSFQGADGSELVEGARIQCEVDGTPGANDLPSRLVFSTTADGASSPTERMRIKSNGTINFSNVATYADNTAALAGGLVAGDVYRKSDGTLMIAY